MTKAEKTREYLIEKAAILFNEKGIAGTSVDDVLMASNLTRGCLYGHFEGKDMLANAAVDYLLEKIVVRRAYLLGKKKSAAGKINAFMDMNKNPLQSYLEGGCPIVNFATEADDTNKVVKEKLKVMISDTIRLLTGILEQGIAQGELSERLKPAEFTCKMFMAIEGASAICRVLDSVQPMHLAIRSLKEELKGYEMISEHETLTV